MIYGISLSKRNKESIDYSCYKVYHKQRMNYTVYSNTPNGPVTRGMVKLINDTGFGVEVRPGSEMPNAGDRPLKLPRAWAGASHVGRFRALRMHLIAQLVEQNDKLRALSTVEDDGSDLNDPDRVARWKDRRIQVTNEQIASAMRVAGAGAFQNYFLDRNYFAVSLEAWREIVEATEVDEVRYVAESTDCDDFAKAFSGIVSLKFGVNACATVVDISGRHAYNVLISVDSAGRVTAHAFEPQTDEIDVDSRRVAFGQGAYPAKQGIAVF